MADLIARAVKRLHRQLCENAGVEIVYFRGNDSAVLGAIALKAETFSEPVEDFQFSAKRRDFGVGMDQLIVGGEKIEPAENDRIEADGKVYRVCALENGRCFRSMDNLGILYRVYTVETGESLSE
jgi:hypothetical protein